MRAIASTEKCIASGSCEREKYETIISHRIDFTNALDALKPASTPGAAEKVVITFR